MTEFAGFSPEAFRAFSRFMERMPREFARVSANVLNTHAFGTRKLAIRNIHKKMEVRAPTFVKGRVKVGMAKPVALNSQFSEVGSMADRDRFSGWVEQELGKRSQETHYGTVGARKGGQWSQKMLPRFRLKPGNKFTSPDEFEGNSRRSRIRNMIRKLSKQKRRQPFKIEGHPKIDDGIYVFGDGTAPDRDLNMVQDLKRTRQPKRIKWLSTAHDEYVRRTNIVLVWERATKRLLKNRRFS